MTGTLDFRRPHLLRDDGEYGMALREVDELLAADPSPGSSEHDRLAFLSVLVEQYERDALPSPAASPRDIVDFMLDQTGRTRAGLAEIMGGKSRVSEFFAGKRELSVNQVRALREALGIPADLLIPD
jgi:HTH-type transcriptional regulator/antitoxin HigA